MQSSSNCMFLHTTKPDTQVKIDRANTQYNQATVKFSISESSKNF